MAKEVKISTPGYGNNGKYSRNVVHYLLTNENNANLKHMIE
jgi:hypothetical protein